MRPWMSIGMSVVVAAIAANLLCFGSSLAGGAQPPQPVQPTQPAQPPQREPDAPPQRRGDDGRPLTHEDLGIAPPWVIDDDDTPAARPPKYGETIRFYQVQIHDGFWRNRLDTLHNSTLPTLWLVNERLGRFGNFEAARSGGPGAAGRRTHRGAPADDADVYRLLEASAWAYAESQDQRLLERLNGGARRVVGAQRPDGYISTWNTLRMPDRRFVDMADGRELSNIGYLMEAAAARYEVDGDRTLLDAARRAAELVMREFGPHGRSDVCGHPQIELGLIRLHDVLGDVRLLETALWFLDRRGRSDGRPSLGERAQDHVPLLEQTTVVGNPVSAMRLFTAAAAIAQLRDDDATVATLKRLWDDLVAERLDIVGSVAIGPPDAHVVAAHGLAGDDAYAWTCAAVALVEWAERMNLLTYDARYIDVAEQALYNMILAGVSLDGSVFFEATPLASHGGSRRLPPPPGGCGATSVARHLSSLRDRLFVRTQGRRAGNTIYVNHYVAGEMSASFGRNTVRIVQRTEYPWDGRVQFWITGGMTRAYRIALRIPAWADSFTVLRDGAEVEVEVENGYAILEGPWTPNQTAELRLSMPVRTIHPPNDRATPNRGRFALARGPLVYCVEAIDAAPDLRRLSIDPTQEFTIARRDGDDDDPLRGMVSIAGTATRTIREGDDRGAAMPEPVSFHAVPYFAWANRDPGAMLVWLPSRRQFADPEPIAGIVPSASLVSDRHPLVALHDGIAPDPGQPASWHASMPHFTWWPQRGSWEWIAYEFNRPRRVAAIELHWFDDLAAGGHHAAPRSVRLLRRDGDDWSAVAQRDVGDADRIGPHGHLTRVEFDPITTEGLRLDVQLAEGRSAALFEWRVVDAPPTTPPAP